MSVLSTIARRKSTARQRGQWLMSICHWEPSAAVSQENGMRQSPAGDEVSAVVGAEAVEAVEMRTLDRNPQHERHEAIHHALHLQGLVVGIEQPLTLGLHHRTKRT